MDKEPLSDDALARRLDAQAMVELATRLESLARQLLEDSKATFIRAANAGSLNAALAMVRLAVADGDYDRAQALMVYYERAGVPAHQLVEVMQDRDLVGAELVEYDGFYVAEADAKFTVISPYPARAAAAVARVAGQLMTVDVYGDIQSLEDEEKDGGTPHDIPYTPNYLSEVMWCRYGPAVSLDTKGETTLPMARKMASILADALIADAVPAYITGPWPGPGAVRWHRVGEPGDASGYE